jgi:3-methyladenine DNA glycosylase/8-oxoguanine DNA glycosylase
MSHAYALGPEIAMMQARCKVRVFPIHFARTFSMQQLGPYDPTASLSDDCFRKAFYYRGKLAAVEICRDGDALSVCAFAEDAQELLDETVAGLTQDDRYFDFATEDRGIMRLHSLIPGMRLLRFPWLYDLTCSAILQQRIRTVDAMRDWRRITNRWGGHGLFGLRAFPPAEVLAAVPRFELERMGVDAKRASALLRFSKELRFVRFKSEMDFATLRQQLLRVPGIGGWTTETVLGYGAGDTDATIPADLHLPRVVCYALAGEFKGTDERMMELLEPFRGHRFRVIRLIYASGLDTPW